MKQKNTSDKNQKPAQQTMGRAPEQQDAAARMFGAGAELGFTGVYTGANGDAPRETQASTLNMPRLGDIQRKRIARNINYHQGNAHLQRTLNHIQRENGNNRGSWSVPFGGGTASTNQQVLQGLLVILQEISQLQSQFDDGEYEDEFNEKFRSIRRMSEQFQGEGEIDLIQAGLLNMWGDELTEFHRQKMGILRGRLSRGLTDFTINPGDTSALESQLAEELHYGFIEGSEDQIGSIREAVEKLSEYNERVQQVLGYARSAASRLNAARTANAIERAIGGSEALGSLAGKVTNVLTAAHSLATISGLDNQAVGSAQNSINQFSAAMEGVDLAMNLASGIPLLGQLWSQWYKPMIDAIVPMLRTIARADDRTGRNLALLDWIEANEAGAQAPRIPRELRQYFPGGQPVLNFMYALVNGGDASPTPAVEAFFLEHRDLFNAGMDERRQLEREGPDWYNPFSWREEERLTNLMSWIRRNSNTVWSMLYGDLPHSLSA